MSKPSHAWAPVNVDARIGAQVYERERLLNAVTRPAGRYPFITISRQWGCEAWLHAQHLIEMLNERCRPSLPWLAYNREVLDRVASELHLSRAIVESLDGRRRDAMTELFDAILNRKVDESLMFRKLAEVVRSLAVHGNTILVGRGAFLITQDLKMGLHVRLEAPLDWRIRKIAGEQNLSLKEAEKFVAERQKEREQFLKSFFLQDPQHPYHHDIVVDTSRFNLAQTCEIIFAALSVKFGENLVGD
jgi:cytidylate kinase